MKNTNMYSGQNKRLENAEVAQTDLTVKILIDPNQSKITMNDMIETNQVEFKAIESIEISRRSEDDPIRWYDGELTYPGTHFEPFIIYRGNYKLVYHRWSPIAGSNPIENDPKTSVEVTEEEVRYLVELHPQATGNGDFDLEILPDRLKFLTKINNKLHESETASIELSPSELAIVYLYNLEPDALDEPLTVRLDHLRALLENQF
jgi:hypothetical protein